MQMQNQFREKLAENKFQEKLFSRENEFEEKKIEENCRTSLIVFVKFSHAEHELD